MITAGFSGSGVRVHESMPPPYSGRSLCGRKLRNLFHTTADKVTCERCLDVEARAAQNTMHDADA